jgi:hypothetical protein
MRETFHFERSLITSRLPPISDIIRVSESLIEVGQEFNVQGLDIADIASAPNMPMYRCVVNLAEG